MPPWASMKGRWQLKRTFILDQTGQPWQRGQHGQLARRMLEFWMLRPQPVSRPKAAKAWCSHAILRPQRRNQGGIMVALRCCALAPLPASQSFLPWKRLARLMPLAHHADGDESGKGWRLVSIERVGAEVGQEPIGGTDSGACGDIFCDDGIGADGRSPAFGVGRAQWAMFPPQPARH